MEPAIYFNVVPHRTQLNMACTGAEKFFSLVEMMQSLFTLPPDVKLNITLLNISKLSENDWDHRGNELNSVFNRNYFRNKIWTELCPNCSKDEY